MNIPLTGSRWVGIEGLSVVSMENLGSNVGSMMRKDHCVVVVGGGGRILSGGS